MPCHLSAPVVVISPVNVFFHHLLPFWDWKCDYLCFRLVTNEIQIKVKHSSGDFRVLLLLFCFS